MDVFDILVWVYSEYDEPQRFVGSYAQVCDGHLMIFDRGDTPRAAYAPSQWVKFERVDTE